MSEQKRYTGSCLCGGLRYEIRGEIGDIVQCHCQRCRKANGTAFAPPMLQFEKPIFTLCKVNIY